MWFNHCSISYWRYVRLTNIVDALFPFNVTIISFFLRICVIIINVECHLVGSPVSCPHNHQHVCSSNGDQARQIVSPPHVSHVSRMSNVLLKLGVLLLERQRKMKYLLQINCQQVVLKQ